MAISIQDGALIRRSGPSGEAVLIFLHCYGDTSYAFSEVVTSPDLGRYAIVVPDLWGFGASPGRSDVRSIAAFSAALGAWIKAAFPGRRIGLIAHSIMAAMAVEVMANLGDQIVGLFSIEGCLTPDDTLYPSKAQGGDDPIAFKKQYLEEIWQLGGERPAMRRYYAGAALADPMTLWALGRDTDRVSRDYRLAEAYGAVRQPTLYYWSRASTPAATRIWLTDAGIPNQKYKTDDHWPMVDQPQATAIAAFFAGKHRPA